MDTHLPAVECIKLNLKYKNSSRYALRDITLSIASGNQIYLIGENGAGKSTFLKAVSGLMITPNQSLKIFGKAPGFCQKHVTYVPQKSNIDWKFPISVYNFVLGGCYVHLGWLKRPNNFYRKKALDIIELLQLQALQLRHIQDLSGGEQQRMLLARALLHDADLFLLDEPLNAIDSETKLVFHTILKKLQELGKTVVITGHEVHTLDHTFDQIFFLKEGALLKSHI